MFLLSFFFSVANFLVSMYSIWLKIKTYSTGQAQPQLVLSSPDACHHFLFETSTRVQDPQFSSFKAPSEVFGLKQSQVKKSLFHPEQCLVVSVLTKMKWEPSSHPLCRCNNFLDASIKPAFPCVTIETSQIKPSTHSCSVWTKGTISAKSVNYFLSS